jgi:hypothetical protein
MCIVKWGLPGLLKSGEGDDWIPPLDSVVAWDRLNPSSCHMRHLSHVMTEVASWRGQPARAVAQKSTSDLQTMLGGGGCVPRLAWQEEAPHHDRHKKRLQRDG